MKYQYLGTAAAEGIPSIFCGCKTCRLAREKGGKEIRTRSQSLIDDTLLLDFPADSLWHMIQYHVDLYKIRHCLIGHIHEDHLYPTEFLNLRKGFAWAEEGWEPFTVHGSEETRRALEEQLQYVGKERMQFGLIKPFEPTEVVGYEVTALKASHGTQESYLYLIRKDGKTALYAHDTGLLPEETKDYLDRAEVHFDFASLDCCEAAKEQIGYNAHMCLNMCIETRETLKRLKVCDEKTIFCLNHFSHNGEKVLYEEMLPIATENGFLLSYDGMTVEF